MFAPIPILQRPLTLSSLSECGGYKQVSTGYHWHDDSAVLPGQEKLANVLQVL